jgi:hypothetical protein
MRVRKEHSIFSTAAIRYLAALPTLALRITLSTPQLIRISPSPLKRQPPRTRRDKLMNSIRSPRPRRIEANGRR